MEQQHTEHVPVMLSQVLDILALQPGMRVVDATLGGGGYTKAFLEAVGPEGRVLAFDWDERAIERFRSRAEGDAVLSRALRRGQLILVRVSYADLTSTLRQHDWTVADAIVADLGLSSDQLADPERGISFQSEGPLDMRLNSDETVEARHLLDQLDELSLADLFETYGDEPEAKRIAKAIVEARKVRPLATTTELRELVFANVVPARRKGKVHPATRVFQALRIAVNSERAHLERFLLAIPEVLRPGGRAVIVSFHSGEDRTVKQLFQKCIRSERPTLRWITKKPLVPERSELSANPRARSAKLRAVERI
ncbi:MAG: 16S rRNA (cytosine(1402)-N(4))-methyltransferase RsmH [Candidatus Moraniibacteriota bacterium]|nr:MAG: 16S rRNA (cytosine(1402)-N(4))-methyltransferase RsmH [Candidatus Moranbacteria bacterium]